MTKPRVWVLRSPSGKLLPETVTCDYDTACSIAFNYLSHKSWARPFWKKWDEFIMERQRRRWDLVCCELVRTAASSGVPDVKN
jgi:hypothetical protein